jgi:mannose-1-phosphate guanylyltransferase
MFAVADLVEKPNKEYCQELIESGVHYWHTGMYLWQLKRIIELFEQYQPAMIDICRKIVASGEQEALTLYSSLEKISIESAITHHVPTIAMSVSNHLGWSDVGKWPAVKRLSVEDEYANVALIDEQKVVDNISLSDDEKTREYHLFSTFIVVTTRVCISVERLLIRF